MNEWRVIRAIVRKDFTEWLHQPRIVLITFLPSLLLVVALSLAVIAVGHNKVALVVEDNGLHAQELVKTIQGYEAFIPTVTTAQDAANLLNNLQVEAVITIPAGFDAAYDARQPDPVTIQINNLNLDFTNDLRRSLPAAITDFYAQQNNSPISVSVNETDMRVQDIGLLQFMIVPLLIQLLTVAGLINTGIAMAGEWESQTIKELFMAPINRASVIAGKFIAGWLITMLFAAVTIALAVLSGYFQPHGIYWLTTLLIVALVALISVGLGVTLAALLRSEQRVIALGINLSFYLFFLGGGIGVVAFLPDWVRTIAHFVPTYYGIHALQMAVFYNSTDLLGRDLLVLLGTAIATLLVGTVALRRRLFA